MRDLEYQSGNTEYRFVIKVDLKNKQSTAYVYRDGEALNDKLGQYDQVVEELFGSFDIFRKSVFSGQNEGSLSELTPGKLKEFFVKLLNLEKYEKVYRPLNKDRLKTIEQEIASEQGKISELEKLVKDEFVVERRLKDEKAELQRIGATIKSLTDKIDEYKNELGKTQARYQESEAAKKETERITEEGTKKHNEAVHIEKSIARKSDRMMALDEKRVQAGEEILQMSVQIENLKKKLSNKDQIIKDYNKLVEIRKKYDSVDEAEWAKGQARTEILTFEKDKEAEIARIEDRLKQFESKEKLAETVPCNSLMIRSILGSEVEDTYPKCPLFIEKIDEKAREAWKAQLKEIKKRKPTESQAKLDKLLKDYPDGHLKKLKQQMKDLENVETQYQKIIDNQQELGESENYKSNQEAQIRQWEQEIATIEDEIKDLHAQHDAVNSDILPLRKKYKEQDKLIDDEIIDQVENMQIEIRRLEDELNDKAILKGRSESIVAACKEDLEKLNLWKESIASLKNVIGDKLDRVEDHKLIDDFLREAPVWELENLAPSIMEHANELLREFYDACWSLLIQTLTPRKSGGGHKEDFKITIYKEEKPRDFNLVSVGQKMMVESVLRQAIKLINQGHGNIDIAFCDESDGAFDLEIEVSPFLW